MVRVKYSLLVLLLQRSHVNAGRTSSHLFESRMFTTDSLYRSVIWRFTYQHTHKNQTGPLWPSTAHHPDRWAGSGSNFITMQVTITHVKYAVAVLSNNNRQTALFGDILTLFEIAFLLNPGHLPFKVVQNRRKAGDSTRFNGMLSAAIHLARAAQLSFHLVLPTVYGACFMYVATLRSPALAWRWSFHSVKGNGTPSSSARSANATAASRLSRVTPWVPTCLAAVVYEEALKEIT